MREKISNFLTGLLKLMFVVIAMSFFYPVLLIVFSYGQMTSLCRDPEGGNLLGEIVLRGVHVLSILVVSFISGMLSPKDRWVIRPASIISVSWYLVNDIIGGIYISINSPGFPLYHYLKSLIIPYILIIFLTYYLCSPLYRYGSVVRKGLDETRYGGN
jgi:hypothetical protein